MLARIIGIAFAMTIFLAASGSQEPERDEIVVTYFNGRTGEEIDRMTARTKGYQFIVSDALMPQRAHPDAFPSIRLQRFVDGKLVSALTIEGGSVAP